MEELQRRLQESEAKRARTVAELTQYKLLLDADDRTSMPPGAAAARRSSTSSGARRSPTDQSWMQDGDSRGTTGVQNGSSSRPSGGHDQQHLIAALDEVSRLQQQLANSERQRAAVTKELMSVKNPGDMSLAARAAGEHGRYGTSSSTTTLLPVGDADLDFGFDPEKEAREHAEQIMAALIQSKHSQRQVKRQLAEAKVMIVELTSRIDAAKQREAEWLRMLETYQARGGNGATSLGTTAGSTSSNSGSGLINAANNKREAATAVVITSKMDSSAVGSSSAESVRVALLEARLEEMTAELSRLKCAQAVSLAQPSSGSGMDQFGRSTLGSLIGDHRSNSSRDFSALPGGAYLPQSLFLGSAGLAPGSSAIQAQVDREAETLAGYYQLERENASLKSRLRQFETAMREMTKREATLVRTLSAQQVATRVVGGDTVASARRVMGLWGAAPTTR